MNSTVAQLEKHIRCPRCGYDQRGVIRSWSDSCPLHGTCSECGLEFNWPEVIVPEKFEPRWCVEFVARTRGIPWACVKTFVRSFWPWAFWSRLKISLPIRKWRLLIYVSFLLSQILVLYAVTQTVSAILTWSTIQGQQPQWSQFFAGQLSDNQSALRMLTLVKELQQMNEAERLDFLERRLPIGVDDPFQWRQDLLDPQNQREFLEARLGSEPHIIDFQIQTLHATIAVLQASPSLTPVINQTLFRAILEAIFLPTSRSSSGSIQFPDGTMWPYPAPVQVLDNLLNAFLNRGFRANLEDWVVRLIVGIICAFLLTILLPATFIPLPVSRQRAKVQWPHVWRILCYSLFAVSTLCVLMYAVVAWHVLTNSNLAIWIARQAPVVFWIVLPAWWALGIKRYLKMPHALAVAVLMTVMLAALMSPVLFVFVLPAWIVRLMLG